MIAENQGMQSPRLRERVSLVLQLQNPRKEDAKSLVHSAMAFFRDHGLDSEVFFEIWKVATMEAVTNAIEHGCKSAVDPHVEVELHLEGGEAMVRVWDPSDFDGGSPRQTPGRNLLERGRGLHLMREFCDEVSHAEVRGGHQISLRKKLPAPWKNEAGALDSTLGDMTAELAASYEMINTLLDLGEWLVQAPDLDSFIVGALERLSLVTSSDAAAVLCDSEEGLSVETVCGDDSVRAKISAQDWSSGMLVDLFQNGEELTLPVDVMETLRDPIAGIFRSAFIAPVFFHSQRIGMLMIGKCSPVRFFDAGQLKIARLVAEFLGIILELRRLRERRETEERMIRDWEIAAEVQASLTPRALVEHPDLRVFGRCVPARKVGGDYFESFLREDGSFVVLVADVMGKGLPAATFALIFRTTVRAMLHTVSTPGALLREVNRTMFEDLRALGVFITCSCAWFSPRGDSLLHAAAGHPPAVVVSPGNSTEFPCEGVPLGVDRDAKFSHTEMSLPAECRILLLTDGITEATGEDGTPFGTDRAIEAVWEQMQAPAEAAVETIFRKVESFAAREEQRDDRTAVVIARSRSNRS